MSGLWTPSGEHVPEPEPAGSPAGSAPTAPPGPGGPGAGGPGGGNEEIDDAVLAEELRRVREELARTPVADIIANHAVGLWQLAVLHLSPEEGQQPNLTEAGLAIDAMAGLVDGLGDRLGPHAEALRDALAQLRVAFVQVRDHAGDA